MLTKRGVRWKWCAPLEVEHGSGVDGGVVSGAPAVRSLRADILLKHKGLTFVRKDALFYVYPGCLPDVMICRRELQGLQCLEQPDTKLIDWEMTAEDLQSLSHMVDAAMVQAHCVMNHVGISDGHKKSIVENKARKSAAGGVDQKLLPVQQLLQDMCQQRERLRERVGKAVSAEAVAATPSRDRPIP